jgi:hypothetical protein
MTRWINASALFAGCGLLLLGSGAQAGFLFASASSPGGAGTGLNLIVREVKVTPAKASVGEVIRVEMIVENQGGEGTETVTARVYASGKPVADKLFHYDITGGTLYHETLFWNTKGAAPGEYIIRGEIFVWGDTSPFDNHLDVKQPVVLVPAGTPLLEGERAGGTAIARDPRYRPGGTPEAGAGRQVMTGGY